MVKNGASCHGLLPDQFTLALDAPAVTRQIAIGSGRRGGKEWRVRIGLAAQAPAITRAESGGRPIGPAPCKSLSFRQRSREASPRRGAEAASRAYRA